MCIQKSKWGALMKDVGSRVKLLRERRGWSQTRLAKETGISNSVLSRIETNEKKTIDHKLTSKIADALHTTTDYLLGKTENPNPLDEESEFYTKLQLDLSNEELIDRYEIIIDGKVLSEEKSKAALTVLKSLLRDREK